MKDSLKIAGIAGVDLRFKHLGRVLTGSRCAYRLIYSPRLWPFRLNALRNG
jgi:hypothetical protein